MKKGQIFMPLITIGLLVLMSTYIFLVYTHQKNTQEFFSIGKLQSQLIKNYFESEKVYFYYEKLLEYNEYKAIKEFSKEGGIPKNCKKRWKFKSDCEPNLKENFKEILGEKLENKYKELNINSEIEVYFTDFLFPTESNVAEVKYEGKILIKKQPLINFEELEKLKLCIEQNIKEIAKCNSDSNDKSVYKFKKKIADILNENLENEEVFIEFEIDIKNSGLGIFN